jgi:hypothetical protein
VHSEDVRWRRDVTSRGGRFVVINPGFAAVEIMQGNYKQIFL